MSGVPDRRAGRADATGLPLVISIQSQVAWVSTNTLCATWTPTEGTRDVVAGLWLRHARG